MLRRRFEWVLLVAVFALTVALSSGLWPNAAVDARVRQLIADLSADRDSRERACVELMRMGPAARAAVPALIAHANGDQDMLVLNALIRIGPAAATAALVQAVESPDRTHATLALQVIAFYGRAAAAAKPALLRAAQDPQLKRAAAEALRAVESDDDFASR